ncbi:DUF397 domain-containing protein [Sciscionella marina]|uniref:DUF397 domain-containing protein n=1 Tax=Sciscionella marina TaxID=508770 RepID=UPI0003684538|nr:DUF397 domain-containing protein [Sciscionella marina]
MSTTRPRFLETDFRKATRSNPNKDCVRVARHSDRVEIRDDKTVFGSEQDHRLLLTAAEFDAYQAAIRHDAPTVEHLALTLQPDGTYRMSTATRPEVFLVFTAAEIAAFHHGVCHHEFDHDTLAAA